MKLREIDILEVDILKEDPVRPHISKAERLSDGRQVFVLENKDKVFQKMNLNYQLTMHLMEVALYSIPFGLMKKVLVEKLLKEFPII